MKHLLVLLGLLLAACGPVIVTPPSISLQEAQRMIDANNATIAAGATESAKVKATADAWTAVYVQSEIDKKATQDMRDQSILNITATAQVAEATQSAAHQTETAVYAPILAATTAQEAREREQARLNDWIAMREAIRFVIEVSAVVLGLLGLAWIVLYFIRHMKEIAVREQHQRELSKIKLARLKLEAVAMAMRETNAGTVVPQSDGTVVVIPNERQLERPKAQSDLQPVARIPVNSRGGTHYIQKLTPEELAGLEQMLELLEATKEWHRREGRSWEKQREIAGYRDCGWHSNYWQARRNLFGDALTSQTSKGTWITDPRVTLKDLWYDVKCGKKKPVLPRGQGAASPSEQPQPTPETTP